MIVLGIDGGFATMGLALVDVTPGGERVVRCWVERTEKSAKKREVRASEDNARRAAELTDAIVRTVTEHKPVAIALESMSMPRNAGAAAKLGVAFGVVFAVCAAYDVPLVQASPQEVKRAVCGRKDASKDDVIDAIERRFPSVEWPPQSTLVEHAADAVAVVLACLDSSVLAMARRLSA